MTTARGRSSAPLSKSASKARKVQIKAKKAAQKSSGGTKIRTMPR